MRGSSAMARAMAPLFCMPPLSSDGMRSATPLKPTLSSFISAIKRIASGGRSVNSSSGNATFSSSVMEPNNAPL